MKWKGSNNPQGQQRTSGEILLYQGSNYKVAQQWDCKENTKLCIRGRGEDQQCSLQPPLEVPPRARSNNHHELMVSLQHALSTFFCWSSGDPPINDYQPERLRNPRIPHLTQVLWLIWKGWCGVAQEERMLRSDAVDWWPDPASVLQQLSQQSHCRHGLNTGEGTFISQHDCSHTLSCQVIRNHVLWSCHKTLHTIRFWGQTLPYNRNFNFTGWREGL